MTDSLLPGFSVAVPFRMHWGEMDAFGHANNVSFIRWLETARIAYFEKLSLALEGGIGPILAHVACDYLKPLHYPADLIVGARMEKVGRTSFTLAHGLARAEAPEELIARGKSVVVLIDYATGASQPLPDEVRRAVERLEGTVPA